MNALSPLSTSRHDIFDNWMSIPNDLLPFLQSQSLDNRLRDLLHFYILHSRECPSGCSVSLFPLCHLVVSLLCLVSPSSQHRRCASASFSISLHSASLLPLSPRCPLLTANRSTIFSCCKWFTIRWSICFTVHWHVSFTIHYSFRATY